MSSKAICNVCNKEITGKIITALDKTWHPEHFACVDCKKPIDGSFNQKDGKIYCSKHYQKNFGTKCKGCGEYIQGKIIQALNASWHEEHFTCNSCKSTLSGTKFHEKDGTPYCNACYSKKFAPRCEGCSTPIESKVITALDKKWHQECFKCGTCSKPVTESSFAVSNGKPLCGKCSD